MYKLMYIYIRSLKNQYFAKGLLHARICMYNIFIGAELVLRHIRNGEELDPIDINRNYDFDFQQLNFIPSVQILPVSYYIIVRC